MAEDNKYGRPIVHPAGVSVAFNPATGEWTKSDKKEPVNNLDSNVLNTGYKQDDFKEAAIAQGLYGQGQTTQPQFVTGQPQQTSIQAAPVQVNVAPAAPANTVVETVVSTAETVGNAVASDLHS